MLKPLVKWAGGKRQIMDQLLANFPEDFGNYHEPFLGAGSVFMEMCNRGRLFSKNVYLSDIMEPLMNLYSVVKYQPERLLHELCGAPADGNYTNDKDSYMSLRNRFNDIKKDVVNNTVEAAALFVYLNKTGFNGMYRENGKGNYNIPFGSQKKPSILVAEHVENLHKFLSQEQVSIGCCSYDATEDRIAPGDFVYMDPPYYNTFTGYNKTEFGEKQQIDLHDLVAKLCTKGCKVALSNSNEQFIRDLYSDIPNVRIVEIEVKRCINSNAAARKNICTELLIVNY
jgi:DNA adenine methylase